MSQDNFTQNRYYVYLDSFRAFAALWVIVYHVDIFFRLTPYFGKFAPYFFRFAFVGQYGVDMFFVISGFLISGLLYCDLPNKIRIKRFYIRRFFKIIPQYMTATICAIVLLPHIKPFEILYINPNFLNGEALTILFPSHNEGADILSHFFFYQNFANYLSILSHTWSLAVEEHFYVFLPLLLVLVTKLFKSQKTRERALIIFFCAIIIGAFVLRLYYAYVLKYIPPIFNLTRYDGLFFGCLLRLIEGNFRRIEDHRWKVYARVLYFFVIFIYLILIFGFQSLGVFAPTLAYIASGALIVSFLRGEPFAFLKHITQNPLIRKIGRISYGLYLWHYILIYPFFNLRTVLGDPVAIALYLGAVLAAGYISTETIERYSLSLRAKWFP